MTRTVVLGNQKGTQFLHSSDNRRFSASYNFLTIGLEAPLFRRLIPVFLSSLLTIGISVSGHPQERVIEILADNDSRYKVQGQRSPVVRLSAGESINLRITAHRGTRWNQDGTVHGFAMVRKNGTYVPGWKFLLKEGLNEFHVVAPTHPGDYIVICTVACGREHEQMNMKIVVVPSRLRGVSRIQRSPRTVKS